MAIVIRELKTHAELKSIEPLQRQIWGCADIDILAPLSLRAEVETGALLFGAYDDDRIVGFMYGFFGYHDGRFDLHSDMTGLLPEYRDRGLGYQLKLRQREWALARGIDTVTWTFDPLRSRNAYFNFHKLGAVCDSYRVNFYGEHSTSALHQNATDRLFVNWRITTERVQARLAGVAPAPIEGSPVITIGAGSEPVVHRVSPGEVEKAIIEIPLEPDAIQAESRELATRWRMTTRAAFLEWTGAGYTVTDAVGGRYLLERGER